ncbi:MAG TPA: lantibiotic dehydratase [Thermoanaerobaculia bacterium]|nr:lantibiotic dehydratase [Thermoanaerobaculia bacterium]
MTAAPILVRVAGLPASAIDCFSSPELLHRTARRKEGEERLRALRESLVDLLFGELAAQPPELRKLMLALKRDCFNRRPLAPRTEDPRWPRLGDALRAPLDEAVRLERQLGHEEEEIRDLWRREIQREREALRDVLDDRSLLRGVSLASQPLAQRMDAFETPADPLRPNRKQRKLEQSLLRYVSRAAVKLSPYSTLTRVGLGTVAAREGDGSLAFVGGDWEETSLLRMRRYIADQIAMVLAYSPALRGEVRLRLNDTLERLPSGQLQLLRPLLLRHDEEAGQLRYARMSLARLALTGPVFERVLEVLEAAPEGLRLDEICDRCQASPSAAGGDEDTRREEIERRVGALLGAGVVLPEPAWKSEDVHLERAIAEGLSGTDPAVVPASLTESVVQLVERESAFASNGQPTLRSLEELNSLIHTVWDESCALAESQLRLQFPAGEKYNFYEDVFLSSAEPCQEIAQLDPTAADQLLLVGDALWHFTDFYQPRRELLLTLDRLIEERWGERASVPFLQLFQEAQELWKDFVLFKYDQRECFDPLDSPGIEALLETREALRHELLELSRSEVLPLDRLLAIRDRIPPEHLSELGACLFVQPLDRSGRRWVLNRLFEGSGRYSSRFSSPMPATVRRHYLAHFIRSARRHRAAGGSEIVDVLYGRDNTVNLHHPQTERVLVIPGESTRLPRHRRLYLKDLRVERQPGRGVPVLTDGRGRRLLPCYFSAINDMYLPVVVKFLSAFGPSSGAGKAIFPWRTEQRRGITVAAPLEAGPLLLRRRRWIFRASALPQAHGDAVDRFLALDGWRGEHGIPRQVFLIEKIDENETGQPVFKPQFIDFGSPLLCDVFFSQLRSPEQEITLEEALPTTDAYPADAAGRRWAVELVVESLSLSHLSTHRAPSTLRRRLDARDEASPHEI